MPLTALYLLPHPPTTPSPCPTLISHLTLTFPCHPLPHHPHPFTLTHHLFASTSSLLPSLAASRQYTQLLTLSHHPATAFVGTTSGTTTDHKINQITIPSGASTDTFLALLHGKLQPHWSHRQTLVVADGTALMLTTPVGGVEVRVGELKSASPRAGGLNNAGGAVRGVIVELTLVDEDDGDDGEDEEKQKVVGQVAGKEDEALLNGLLERLLDGTGLKMEGVKGVVRHTAGDVGDGGKRRYTDWTLSEMYMEVLRSKT